MQLLVSVQSAEEAVSALDGGADVIDAKDPRAGALGAVSLDALHDIHAAVASRRPVTAAIGDAGDEATVEAMAGAFAAAGTRFVKVGFGGITSAARIESLAAAAQRGAVAGTAASAVVLVAYADGDSRTSITPAAAVDIAVRVGARGVLLDTADKHGPGLIRLLDRRALIAWVDRAHDGGLFVALAGKLVAGDLPLVRDAGADIAGLRGAACEGGRTGRVSSDRVRQLRSRLDDARGATLSGWPRVRPERADLHLL
jgi:(5-formylfuran-3-yl)methyl phosphate synthase